MTTDIENPTQPLPAQPPSAPGALRAADAALHHPGAEPWPDPVPGELLLDALSRLFDRFLVLPPWAPEALALWTLHTYASHLRDVSAYIGIESPLKRCGKTTLLTLLAELVHRPVVAANISPSAFFRVIEQLRPTLLIDEADTVLRKNDELRGILNAGYKRDTAYVVRVANQPAADETPDPISPASPEPGNDSSGVKTANPARLHSRSAVAGTAMAVRFSTWCPKAIAAIGHLPDTLADRCIIIRMHRKSSKEPRERLRNLDGTALRRQCARFIADCAPLIASAKIDLPPDLHDRAADIWEPLLILADLAGGDWPKRAREAASALTLSAQEENPIGSLFLDIVVVFLTLKADRLSSRDLVSGLRRRPDRPWFSLKTSKDIDERWLSDRLREYGIRPKCLRIAESVVKGYLFDDFRPSFRRYATQADRDAYQAEFEVEGENSDSKAAPIETPAINQGNFAVTSPEGRAPASP